LREVLKIKFTINSLDEHSIFNEYERFWSKYDEYRIRRSIKNRGIKANKISLIISFIVILIILFFISGKVVLSLGITLFLVVPLGLITFQILDQTKFSKKYDEWLIRNISKSNNFLEKKLYKANLSRLIKMLPLEYLIRITEEEIKIMLTSKNKTQNHSHSFGDIEFAYISRNNLIFITKGNIKSLYKKNTARVPIISPELRKGVINTFRKNKVSLYLEDHFE
jgi:hypothetical protein